MTYDISTAQSTFTYPDLSLIAPSAGVNYFNNLWKHVDTYTYTGSTNTGKYNEDLINSSTQSTHKSLYCLYHVYGTITRDITDNAAFYLFANTLPPYDQVTLIPVKPYQSEIPFDLVNITNKNTASYNYYRMWIQTCDKDYNYIRAKSNISITVDYYCL